MLRLKWQIKRFENRNKNKDLLIVNQRTPFWKVFLLLLPAFSILTIFTIIPFAYTIRDGLQYSDPNDTSFFAKSVWSLKNFALIFKDQTFVTGITNSMFYALISVPIIMIFSLIISSAISAVLRERLRGIFQTIFFLPYVTSAVAISLAFAFLFENDGILNKVLIKMGFHGVPWLTDSVGRSALWAMLIFGIWKGMAFNILIFTTAMLSVDKNLYKSASIDCASPRRQFFKITLPNINGTINFLLIMGLIGAIKTFPLALFNNNSSLATQNNGTTIMIYIFKNVSMSGSPAALGKAGAASITLLAISISYTVIVKGGYNKLLKIINRWGEKRVERKIKI